jgi:hypothetical protein
MRGFGCLHTSTFGARSSGRALPFLGGAAFDLLRRPWLPALRAFAGRSRHLLAKLVAMARFAIWPRRHGLRPHLHPRRLGAAQVSAHSTTSRLRQCLSCVICSTLGFGGTPALRLRSVGPWLDALPPTASRSAPRQRKHQPTNKESNQSVSGSERKPRKGRRLKHILDTALPCDAKLNSDGCERIKSPLLSYRRR